MEDGELKLMMGTVDNIYSERLVLVHRIVYIVKWFGPREQEGLPCSRGKGPESTRQTFIFRRRSVW